MAQENVQVTLTLTDEMSESLTRLMAQYQNLQRQISETGRAGEENFRRTKERVEQTTESLGKVGKSLEGLPKQLAEPLRLIEQRLGNMPGLFGLMGRSMGEATQGAAGFARVLGTVGVGAGGVVTAIGAVAAGTTLFASKMAEAGESARLLRLSLSETSDTGIEKMRRLYERIGAGGEAGVEALKKFAPMYQDLSRGVDAELSKILYSHGAYGAQIAEHMRAMLLRGESTSKAWAYLLQAMRSLSHSEFQQIARELSQIPEQMERASDEVSRVGNPYEIEPAKLKQIEQDWHTVWLGLQEVYDLIGDLKTRTFEWLGPFATNAAQVVQWLEAIARSLGDVSAAADKAKQATTGGRVGASAGATVGGAAWRALNPFAVPLEILGLPGGSGSAEWLGGQLGAIFGSGGMTLGGVKSHIGEVEAETKERQAKDEEQRRRRGRLPVLGPGPSPPLGPQRFGGGDRDPFAYLGYSPASEAGARGDVRDIKDATRASEAYLQQITDVLTWIRTQMEGGAGGAAHAAHAAADAVAGPGPGGPAAGLGVTAGAAAAAAAPSGSGSPQFFGGGALGDMSPQTSRRAGTGENTGAAAPQSSSLPDTMTGDITGRGPSGGHFNVPAGTPPIGQGERETVTLDNGQRVTVNKRAAEQFRGFFNDLIKAGAPVHNLGGIGQRSGNPSQHPAGLAVDWAQHSRNVVDRDVRDWIGKNRETLSAIEKRWGMSGGEHWRSPDTGHFSVDTLYGPEHLKSAREEARGGGAIQFPAAADTMRIGPWRGAARIGVPQTRQQHSTNVDRHSIDRSIAGQWNSNLGSAQVNVAFGNAGAPSRERSLNGVFKQITLAQTPAMNTTGSDNTGGHNLYTSEAG